MYLTGRGVTVFDKAGKKLMNIPISEAWTGNVTFSLKDRQRWFITASKSVYGVQMRLKGACRVPSPTLLEAAVSEVNLVDHSLKANAVQVARFVLAE